MTLDQKKKILIACDKASSFIINIGKRLRNHVASFITYNIIPVVIYFVKSLYKSLYYVLKSLLW